MPDWNPRANDLFLRAADIEPTDERRAFLVAQCADDPALRQQVESLLAASEGIGNFLDRPVVEISSGAGPTADYRPLREGPGTVIGPYKLLQQIGEGGFGVVFMAEQERPVRRMVALKIIKPGMDTREVIARFEAERQALAIMDHPNIAKVLDAGATPSGRPYFVMELVKGIPITEFCDRNHMPAEQRLKLFIDVCHAIQHAHHKGVIHRDVKPTNVMVTLHDGVPVVKVIDFGVAKATAQKLTERTLFTSYGQMVGTPAYMSPEQAEMSGLDIDTRSDIYSLGVLLYELLTGTTPLEAKRLREAGFAEMQRLIREEEPPRPSTRMSSLGQSATVLAGNRGTDPKQLARMLAGELDWIVMKSLDKDRSRRYETANGLARDLERYLADESVEACPPSVRYRMGKVLRKYRRPLMTAAVFAVLLLAGGAMTGWQAVRLARSERDRLGRDRDAAVQQAKRERDVREALSQATTLRERARAANDLSKWADARSFAKRAEGLLEGGPVDEGLPEQVRTFLNELDIEVKDQRLLATLDDIRLRRADLLEEGFTQGLNRTIPEYAAAFGEYGFSAGQTRPEEIAHLLGNHPKAVREALIEGLSDWFWHADIYETEEAQWLHQVLTVADPDEWRTAARAAQAARDATAMEKLAREVDVTRQPPGPLDRLAFRLSSADRQEAALELRLRIHQRYPADFWNLFWLSLGLARNQPAEAVRFSTAALALRPNNYQVLMRYAGALRKNGKLQDAIAVYRRAIELKPDYSSTYLHLAAALKEAADTAGASACYDQVVALNRDKPDELALVIRRFNWEKDSEGRLILARKNVELDPSNAQAHYNLGHSLRAQGDRPAAMASFRKALELNPKFAPAHVSLGEAWLVRGDLPRAIESFREALKHEPQFAHAHFSLGQAYWAQDDLPAAIDCFRKTLEHNPRYPQAHVCLGLAFQKQGNALMREGKWKDAAASYREATEHHPTYVPAHAYLGHVLTRLGDSAGAVASFRQAAELDPENADRHGVLGDALRADKKWDEAITCYRKVIELDPQRAPTYYKLGVILSGQEKWEEAIACYRKAIELAPNDVLAHNNLAWLLATCPEPKWRDPVQAVTLAKKAVELEPKTGDFQNTLGAALYRAGEWKAAIAAIEKSMQLRNGGDGTDWFFLAMAHAQLGEKDKAREWYDKAVAWMDHHRPASEELRRFRAEAEEMLGIAAAADAKPQ